MTFEDCRRQLFDRIQTAIGADSLGGICDTYGIENLRKNLVHNVTFVSKHGLVANINSEDQPPDWLLSAVHCLMRWPERHDESLPNYPGFEKDVLMVISNYFNSLPNSLITNSVAIVMLKCFDFTVNGLKQHLAGSSNPDYGTVRSSSSASTITSKTHFNNSISPPTGHYNSAEFNTNQTSSDVPRLTHDLVRSGSLFHKLNPQTRDFSENCSAADSKQNFEAVHRRNLNSGNSINGISRNRPSSIHQSTFLANKAAFAAPLTDLNDDENINKCPPTVDSQSLNTPLPKSTHITLPAIPLPSKRYSSLLPLSTVVEEEDTVHQTPEKDQKQNHLGTRENIMIPSTQGLYLSSQKFFSTSDLRNANDFLHTNLDHVAQAVKQQFRDSAISLDDNSYSVSNSSTLETRHGSSMKQKTSPNSMTLVGDFPKFSADFEADNFAGKPSSISGADFSSSAARWQAFPFSRLPAGEENAFAQLTHSTPTGVSSVKNHRSEVCSSITTTGFHTKEDKNKSTSTMTSELPPKNLFSAKDAYAVPLSPVLENSEFTFDVLNTERDVIKSSFDVNGNSTNLSDEKSLELLRLCCLCLPPPNRLLLHVLLQLLHRLVYDCAEFWTDQLQTDRPTTEDYLIWMTDKFRMSILKQPLIPESPGPEGRRNYEIHIDKIVGLLISNFQHIMTVPENFRNELVRLTVSRNIQAKFSSPLVSPAAVSPVYCSQITVAQYNSKAETRRQLEQLLLQINTDQKLSAKQRKKKLKQFREIYPEIYNSVLNSPSSIMSPSLPHPAELTNGSNRSTRGLLPRFLPKKLQKIFGLA